MGNIFARIIRKNIPCDRVRETEHSLSFRDISPQAVVHVLAIPKGPYIHMGHFLEKASAQEKDDFFSLVARLPQILGVEKTGYRWITNAGQDGGQEVNHFHMHLLAGQKLPLIKNGKIV